MPHRISLLLAIGSCLIFSSFASADVIVGSASFNNGDILDAPNNQVMSTISIADSATINDITVTIRGLSHSNVGDLIAELRFLGNGGPSGPGGEPAYLFFRPNVDGADILGSRANFGDGQGNGGTYSFGSTGANLWQESAIGDNETVPEQQYFTSDELGLAHDLGGPEFFEGIDVQGDWQLVITDDNAFGTNEGSVESWSIEFDATVAIPEPAISSLIVFGIAAFSIRRKR